MKKSTGIRLAKCARIATKAFDYVVEFLPKGMPYAICIRFAPGGGPPIGGAVVVWFDDIARIYSFGQGEEQGDLKPSVGLSR